MEELYQAYKDKGLVMLGYDVAEPEQTVRDFVTSRAFGWTFLLDNGTTCSYRISVVWRNVDAVDDYPQLIASERLYDQQGPERLFLATCGGPWVESARMFKDINVVLATPVRSESANSATGRSIGS